MTLLQRIAVAGDRWCCCVPCYRDDTGDPCGRIYLKQGVISYG